MREIGSSDFLGYLCVENQCQNFAIFSECNLSKRENEVPPRRHVKTPISRGLCLICKFDSIKNYQRQRRFHLTSFIVGETVCTYREEINFLIKIVGKRSTIYIVAFPQHYKLQHNEMLSEHSSLQHCS